MSLESRVGASLERITPSAQTVRRLLAGVARHIADAKSPTISPETRFDVVSERLADSGQLLAVAEADADQPIVVPEVDDILSILIEPPTVAPRERTAAEPVPRRPAFSVNYLEREAHNRSLGFAGEELVLNYERARLIRSGQERLAGSIEHVSRVRGDAEGFDILSFEESGQERLIEVKTTSSTCTLAPATYMARVRASEALSP